MDPKALWIKRLLKMRVSGDPVKKLPWWRANTWEDHVKGGPVVGYVFLALFIGFILWLFFTVA